MWRVPRLTSLNKSYLKSRSQHDLLQLPKYHFNKPHPDKNSVRISNSGLVTKIAVPVQAGQTGHLDVGVPVAHRARQLIPSQPNQIQP